MVIAIIASLVPYPLWSMGKAKGTASAVTEELATTWEHIIIYYSGSRGGWDDKLDHEMRVLLRFPRRACGRGLAAVKSPRTSFFN